MTPFLKCDETLADALRARLPDTMQEAVRRCTLRVLIPLVNRHDVNFHGLAYVTAGNIGYAVLFARFVLFPIVLLTLLVRVYFSGLQSPQGFAWAKHHHPFDGEPCSGLRHVDFFRW